MRATSGKSSWPETLYVAQLLRYGFLRRATSPRLDFLGFCDFAALGKHNPARTIAHSPLGVKGTLNYMLREKMHPCTSLSRKSRHGWLGLGWLLKTSRSSRAFACTSR